MKHAYIRRAPLLACLLACSSALSQPLSIESETDLIAPVCQTVPALTPIAIEIAATVGSKISKSGDRFPIRLAAPIMAAGKELIPAGTTGEGEVVHAKKAGGMGAAGELVLAARYLDVGGRQLRLRSFTLASAQGKDRIGTANAVGMAVGIPGMFVTGHQILVQPGTLAQAKVAADFSLSGAHAGMADEPRPSCSQKIEPSTQGVKE